MTPFRDEDFPVYAVRGVVRSRRNAAPICECASQEMAAEIAKRLNRDKTISATPNNPMNRCGFQNPD